MVGKCSTTAIASDLITRDYSQININGVSELTIITWVKPHSGA